jgi:cysteine-rich repeat protein
MMKYGTGCNSWLAALALVGFTGCGDAGGGGGETGNTSSTSDGTSTTTVTTTTTVSPTGETTDSSGSGGSNPTSTTGTTDPTTSTTDPTATGTTTSTTGPDPVCGDGAVDPGEECDDGPANADDAACTAGCKTAICGDMLVQGGVEECDDGNMDDLDACVAGCKNASCGDGFIGPGEACDDGNMVDDDACSNMCAAGSCGDGKVQMGEECDDGNDVDTDACLGTCLNAKCGDMIVQAMTDECDDGNMSNLDMCTNMCKLPTCTDKIQDGAETDVDCGAACPKCAVGLACTKGSDCGTGFCSMNKCTVAPSCKAIKTADPMAKDGIFNIDPDGNGPVAAFDVYCDMTIDGGGWTLVLKGDGSKTTFLYSAALWTNNALLNAGMTALDRNEAKFSSWNTVPFTDVLVGFESPILNMGALTLKTQKITTGAKASMFAMMSPNVYVAPTVAVGRVAWKALITGSSLQANCNQEGFNVLGRSRIGIVSNQENDCNSPDSYIGIGNIGVGCNNVAETRVGNMASCTPDNGDKSLPAFGVVFVR